MARNQCERLYKEVFAQCTATKSSLSRFLRGVWYQPDYYRGFARRSIAEHLDPRADESGSRRAAFLPCRHRARQRLRRMLGNL